MLKKRLISTIIAVAITFFAVNDVYAAPQVERMWANDKYQTCSGVVQEKWKISDYDVPANEENFPDALGATVLSKNYNTSINTVGNTSGNMVNYGRYAVQGKWAYYSNFDDGGKLYKIKVDGTESVKLSRDNAKFINVVGDWIYYVANKNNKSYINKIKIDGSSRITLSLVQSYLTFLNVYKDRIYYIDLGSNSKANNWYYSIIAINVDGTNLGEVYRFPANSSPAYFNIVEDYGYCLVNEYGSKDVIYKFSLDGSKQFTKLAQGALTFNVVGGWVYYGTSGQINEIRKVKVDGTEDQKLTNGFPAGLHQWGDATCLNVEGNWIYYKDYYEQAIYRMDISGNNKTKLADCMAESISIVGDYLYCPAYGTGNIYGEFYEYKNMRKIKK